MRKIIFAAVATVALSAPLAASADEITVREHPNGNVTVKEHGPPPAPGGDVVVRERVAPAPPETVIREHDGPRGDSVTIKER
jgi:Prokaryotic membrane lipoprotein lipid attachment site